MSHADFSYPRLLLMDQDPGCARRWVDTSPSRHTRPATSWFSGSDSKAITQPRLRQEIGLAMSGEGWITRGVLRFFRRIMDNSHGCISARVSALVAACLLPWVPCFSRTQKPGPFAQVAIHAGREGCAVDLDSSEAGKTTAGGVLVLGQVEPGDHYIHVRCQGEPEVSYFVTLAEGQRIETNPENSLQKQAASAGASPEFRGKPIELREHIQKAVQLRSRGRIEEAVQHLRAASRLDPDNSDLHCELGITFLLGKDWKRARVEMLEAVRHDPTNADAHNGLGYALEKLGRLDDALKEYRAASKLDPDDSSYRQHYIDALGKVYAQQAEKKK